MKKKALLAATMAAMLASCSSDDLSLQSSNQEASQGGAYSFAFDALTQRGISTRAGYAGGVMNDDQLKASKENDGGFGVFAYDTSAPMYESQSSDANFMWNQGVFYNGSSFEYAHVHYWPQHYGSDAQSDGIDQVSFFAYAPYVDASTNGKVAEIESGITGFTSNTAKGDPRVKYVASFLPSKSVDLCWGVCDEADKDWKIIQGNAVQEMTAGLPWIDVQRPAKAIGQKVKFTFKHALAQLNVQIDADPDIEEHNVESKIAEGTKVYVRSITFSGLAQKGALNLNNTEANIANWEVYNCCGETLQGESVTLYDGRKDKMEGVAGAVASSEKLQCLNPTIISDDNNTTEGVTHELKNLFNSTSEDAPVYVIPTGDDFTVTISYDIESANPNLPGYLSDKKTHGFSDPNTITKQVKFGDLTKLENGKKYLLKIHLGLNSIKFDADVTDWDDTAEAGNVYLPSNVAQARYGVALDESSVGMFVGADGKAYPSVDDATAKGTTAQAWIAYKSAVAGESLAIALNDDYDNDISWNDFNASTNNFTTSPARDAIDGGEWRWPSGSCTFPADISQTVYYGDWGLMLPIIRDNFDACPLEYNKVYHSTTDNGEASTVAFYINTEEDAIRISNNDKSYVTGRRVRAVFAF